MNGLIGFIRPLYILNALAWFTDALYLAGKGYTWLAIMCFVLALAFGIVAVRFDPWSYRS